MNYREDIKKCFAEIKDHEKSAVNMQFSMGFSMDITPIFKTLDDLKIMMVYAWERLGYGTYKDFFHGKELETKYLSFLKFPHQTLINDFKKYLDIFRVKTIFDDDIETLEKMKEIINYVA